MKIENFTDNHIERAAQIAMACYNSEREATPVLPAVNDLPPLTELASNKLGVAAFDNGEMLGFLCCCSPFSNAFGTTGVKGTFSPIHAHGVISANRRRTYALMYEAAAKKWVEAGIASHSIGLYAHDKETVEAFFRYGFGLRCVDAIRLIDNTEGMEHNAPVGYSFSELDYERTLMLYDMFSALVTHLGRSPAFMKYTNQHTREGFASTVAAQKARYFGVEHKGRYVAYIKISSEGENFAACDPSVMNICGAYCLPEYRGTGIYRNLLAYLNAVLKSEGYIRLGVDYESFNPTASGFWLKYFTAYTYGVVRRIDNNAVPEL